MLDRNAVLYGPEYSGAVFVADSTVANCFVTGGRIIGDENTLTGISIRANALGQYTQKCEFSNMEIKGCLTGIAFYTDNSGFINANDFYNIWIDNFVNGITAYEGASSTGLSGNYFSNLTWLQGKAAFCENIDQLSFHIVNHTIKIAPYVTSLLSLII